MPNAWRNLRFKAKLAVSLGRIRALQAFGSQPVVTYATYRTASTSVHWALRRALGGRAIKAHALNPDHFTMEPTPQQVRVGTSSVPLDRHVGNWVISSLVVQARRPASFVIMIRDPVAVAVSSFAVSQEWLSPELANHVWPDDGRCDDAILNALQGALFDSGYTWRRMATWFDEDVRPALGWDAYAAPFDQDAGIRRAEHGPWQILVMRADVDDALKASALANFVGVPAIELGRDGTAGSRGHGGLSAAVRRAVARRPAEVDELLQHRFTRHFWTSAQIQAMRDKWLGG